MSRGPVFDFHARLAPRPQALERLLSAMDASGIDRAAVCTGGVLDMDTLATQVMTGGFVENDPDNAAVLDACEQSGGRLVPLFFANPHRPADHYRKQAADFRGLEISPAVHGVPLMDPSNVALVEVAAEFGHSVYVVCIGRPGCGAPDLVRLAQQFPEVTFVLGHCGFVGIDLWSVNQVVPQQNIVAETSGCYTVVARAAVERLGPERVVFGTEHPVSGFDVEVTKMRSLDLDPDSWRQVMWTNACRLLREEMS
jgi:predicted TIM-barrel fold metal-dependent hydrolase